MDFAEAGRRLKLAIVLCALGYGGWWLFIYRMRDQTERTIAESQEDRFAARVLMPDGEKYSVDPGNGRLRP